MDPNEDTVMVFQGKNNRRFGELMTYYKIVQFMTSSIFCELIDSEALSMSKAQQFDFNKAPRQFCCILKFENP